MTIATGTKLGRYEIRSKIGEGGMGEVYLGQDTKLDRRVAIKFLNEECSKDADKLNRFIQEAKAASALNHPNILTVYEIGEIEGKNYIATELIDGHTLRQHLSAKEPLPLNQILKIGVQVAEALAAAHQAGIIHRDIKPENVMVRRDGYIKVLDFGLAKLTEPLGAATDGEAPTKAMVNTGAGTLMGTANYMSPEQAKGVHVDARTDIWSLGALLYEMVSSRVPFAGETPTETISLILQKDAAPLRRFAPNVPNELERIVTKALTKDREERYQTMKDLLIDLRALKRKLEVDAEIDRTVSPELRSALSTSTGLGVATGSAVTPTVQASLSHASSAEYVVSGIKNHKIAVAALVVILLIGGVTAVGFYVRTRTTTAQIKSIAVMPFVNESGNADLEYLSDGMTETLISSLTQLPNLKVKARSSVFRYKGKETDPNTLGKELNVQAILTGRVIQRGDQLTLSLELVDVQTENAIWSQQYSRKQADLVSLQSEIARDVSSKIRSKLSGVDEARVTKTATANPEAYQLYLKGRFYWNQRGTRKITLAVEQFKAAVEKDPNYALAYAGLADCYVLMAQEMGTPETEALPQAKAYADRALQLDESLSEAHASLGLINEYLCQWTDAEKEFRRALELNPNYPTAHQWYGIFLGNMGRSDQWLAETQIAYELDPLSPAILVNVGLAHLIRGDVEPAIEQLKKTGELSPNFFVVHSSLALAYLKQGRNTDARAEAQQAVELSNRDGYSLSVLGYVHGRMGNRNEALAIISELERNAAKAESDEFFIAIVYAGLGDKDQAFSWLEKSFQKRNSFITNLRIEPGADSLRDDPRYKDIIRRMGLPE